MRFESLDIDDGGEGSRRWKKAGKPIVPCLVVDGVATPVLHVSQLAEALGLPPTPAQESTRLAWATLPVLRSWLDRLRDLDPDLLTRPTQSRGRTLRNLTVNVFHPFELLPAAWQESRFPWKPEDDADREASLTSAAAVVAYAERILAAWTDFVTERGDELDRIDPLVSSPRGDVRYSSLLDSQLEHVLFHHEQLTEFLAFGDARR